MCDGRNRGFQVELESMREKGERVKVKEEPITTESFDSKRRQRGVEGG